MYGRWLRNSFIYLLILVAIVAIVFTVFANSGSAKVEQSLQDFVADARAGNVTSVEVDGSNVTYKLAGDQITYKTKMEEGDTVRQVLLDAGMRQEDLPDIKTKEPSQWGNLLRIFLQFLPIIFIVAILFFFLRQAQGSNNQALSFGKSRARMFTGNRPSVTFLDVAGVEWLEEYLSSYA